MQFTADSTAEDVRERCFTLGDVPGILWSPAEGPGRAVVLMGHGGGLHKRSPGLVSRARTMVTELGFHAAAIDIAGHGERPRSQADQRWVDAMVAAREAGRSITDSVVPYNASLAERTVPEWIAVLDALQALPEIGSELRVGYSGMTVATAIGIPLAAADDRIAAAIFGGVFAYDAVLEAARRITIPVEYLLPWDDAELDRASGLEVFDAFASTEKTLHAFAGTHFRVPPEQVDTGLFARKLPT